ncbi:hypothetical protein SASPL_157519 [Salvia splendens]|uniref:VTT domain-containing protein n=1 Tax=Salvia splendens TaxID=180675 RepID=A0A8X8YU44_SALSN|nr:hypothetical protein SASPL_157519 [Salvia splendens]
MGLLGGRWGTAAAVIALAAAVVTRKHLGEQLGWDNSAMMQWLKEMSDRLGHWAIPAYVGLHTITLALCLPYAVFFEAGASMLFGFLPALLFVFRSYGSAAERVQKNKYFNMLSRGVERDGWKFVLLARFSPVPSYVINYALAATNVGFLIDFLLPTVIGCMPMILQNTSIGSLASAAVGSASGSQKSQVWSYLFPLLGISSSVLISLRIKKYSTDILTDDSPATVSEPSDAQASSQEPVNSKSKALKGK